MSRADELQTNLVQARARALEAELALRRHDNAALVSECRRLKRENEALAHENRWLKARRRSHDGHEAARTVFRPGQEFLERLKGEWQSLQMGYIEVYAEEGMGMLVKTAGKDGALLGRLFASAEFGGGLRINLERSFGTRAKTKAYHINGPETAHHAENKRSYRQRTDKRARADTRKPSPPGRYLLCFALL